MLSILIREQNRRILFCLSQREGLISVEELTTNVAALDASTPVTDSLEKTGNIAQHSNS